MNDPTRMTISELKGLLRDREVSAQELLVLHLDRIESADPEVKA
jgi:Asp-tRNA(Asn)/Glu-tRNA(Gln) amidotransferase A subunit family amidase